MAKEESPSLDFMDDDAGSPPPSSRDEEICIKIILDPINTDESIPRHIKRIAPVMHIKIVYIPI
jgi:hypothetical protein